MIAKFDKWDRRSVIRLIQETFGVTLDKVGRGDTWWRDKSGTEWCIIGGIGNFHGIPERIIECEREASVDDRLVIAEKLVDSLNVYVGSLQSLIDARHDLPRRHRDNAYLFNVVAKKSSMGVVEAPSVVLRKIGAAAHTASNRDSIRKAGEFERLVGSMSPDELAEALEELRRNKE